METYIPPIVRIDITDEVIQRVKHLLASGILRAGSKLPPEREFARVLGISRPSLRQGLKALATMGVIFTRSGDGTYVSNSASEILEQSIHFLLLTGAVPMAELFEVRKVVEVELAGLAAARVTPQDLAEMEKSLAGMEATLDNVDHYLPHDFNFHNAIAKAARNSLFHAIIENLGRLLMESRQQTVQREPSMGQAINDHTAIYYQIQAGNVAGAREAMFKHLDRIQNYWEEKQSPVLPRSESTELHEDRNYG
jgi:GntR family transcriptional repressor for pyruvate dehydrogenase complex